MLHASQEEEEESDDKEEEENSPLHHPTTPSTSTVVSPPHAHGAPFTCATTTASSFPMMNALGALPEELVAPHSNKPQLTVLVDGTLKVGTGLGAHVEYQLSFRTTLPGLPLTGAVGRRFRDFKWLHDALREEWRGTGVILPPLPHGQTTLYRFEEGFVEARRVSLEVFCRRCAAHPLVRESRSLAAFLAETDPGRFNNVKEEFAAAAAAAAARRGSPRGFTSSSPSSSPATWIHRLSPSRGSMLRSTTPGSPAPTNLAPHNSRWGHLVHYLDLFEDRMLSLRRAAKSLATAAAARGVALEEIGRAATAMGIAESEAFGVGVVSVGHHPRGRAGAEKEGEEEQGHVMRDFIQLHAAGRMSTPARATPVVSPSNVATASAAQRENATAAACMLGSAFLELGTEATTLGRREGTGGGPLRAAGAARDALQTHFKEAIRYVRAVRSAVDDLNVAAGELSSLERKRARSVAQAEKVSRTAAKAAEKEEEKKKMDNTSRAGGGGGTFGCVGGGNGGSVDADDAVTTGAAAANNNSKKTPSSGVQGKKGKAGGVQVKAERANAVAAELTNRADEARCRLDTASIQLETEVVHWHAQQSTEMGACLRAFVGAERRAGATQVEVWSRVLGHGQ